MTAQQLKNSILQLAVQGKLVPQDKNDEPASELLKRIKTEKAQLIKEGKLKKEKVLPTITDEEIPFDIPDSWEWIKFGELVSFNAGKTPARNTSEYWQNGTKNWVSIKDMTPCSTVVSTKEKISEKAMKDVFRGKLSPKGTLIMSFKLTIGRTSILGLDAVHNEAIISIFTCADNEEIIKNYLLKTLPLFTNFGDSRNAIKGKTLNDTSLNNLLIPLPPLVEQQRIVEKIEEYLPFVEAYDTAEAQRKKLDEELPERLKKSILQQAVQGKLAPQDKNDEPARALLKRIKAEKAQLIKDGKIKKEKPLSPITEEEKHFDIPNSWGWVRLQDVCTNITVGGDKPKDFSTIKTNECGIPVIANGVTNDGIIGYTGNATITAPGVTVSGRGTIGYSSVRDYCFTPIVRLICLIPHSDINLNYLCHVLSFLLERGEGTSIPQLTVPMILPKLIPLPPLAEQQRIVDKIEEYMSFVEQLKIGKYTAKQETPTKILAFSYSEACFYY